ncbi:MAG: FAD-dependent oxidoreductase [Pseudomonadota bacterium]
MPTSSEIAGTVIIGGGAIGLGLAYHLAQRGAKDVVLLERNELTSGTSWHAAGIVGPLRATPNMTKLAMYALELFPKLTCDTGLETGYRQTGGYWIARREERLDELHRICALGRHFGLSPRMVGPDELTKSFPQVSGDGVVGAATVGEDASVNPVDLCMAYARAASAAGVKIRQNIRVTEIVCENGRVAAVELEDGSRILADRVALCAGAWSKDLAASAGLALPLQPVEHMYVVTEPMPGLPNPIPVLRDMDTGFYVKGDAGRLVIGAFEMDAKCWDPNGPEGDRAYLELPEDWDQFGPYMERALTLIPDLERTGIQRFMNGPESFTTDTRPYVGEAPDCDGLFVAAGLNSVGIMSSAGIGRALADWMEDGHPPMNLWEVDVARADPAEATAPHMADRMREAVGNQFAMHWPYKQPKHGRGIRRTPMHQIWSDAGAQFGVTGGWERPLYFGAPAKYSVAEQGWWANAAQEAAAMSHGAALIDLTPFSKFHVVASADALNEISTAQLDVPVGRVVYTQLLNQRAGIEGDLTVMRLAEDRWRITSGAGTRWRDFAFLRRALGAATVTDVTEREAVIGVMGHTTRDVLGLVVDTDWHDFPFATFRDISFAKTNLRAARISYVGELGWELTLPNDIAATVCNLLLAAGAKPMGLYAVDGCRLEKGFRHWGHDIGPTITPIEAGLGFTIDWLKPFAGKEVLAAQKGEGPAQKLVLLAADGAPLLLHDEPVWQDGSVIGLTTSGARGPRTGQDLCFAMVDPDIGPDVQIEVAGKLYPARVLDRVPFDPTHKRMRG